MDCIVIFVFSCNFPELVEECLVLLADGAGKESRVPIAPPPLTLSSKLL